MLIKGNPMRTIFHIDVNSAYLSWEATRRRRKAREQGEAEASPDLRDIPSIIGGDPSRRTSIVLAKSVPAKKYGIVTGEPVSAALRKCPHLVIAPSDFVLYSEMSHAFKAILRECSMLPQTAPAGRMKSRRGCSDSSGMDTQTCV